MSEQKKMSKKRKKAYYRKCSNKRQKMLNNLDVDSRGFLLTCNNYEKQAVREAYNILNEYADELYGPEKKADLKDSEAESESEGEDMEKEMQKEIDALKKEKRVERRFQNVNTKAKNCIFIKTTLEDPCELAYTILTDLASTKKQKTRFALRLLPISGTCRALIDDIKNLSEKLLKPHFDQDNALGFTIVHKIRNNDSICRVTLLPAIGQVVKEMNALHRVCHDEPDVVVFVEIIGKICCMSIVKEFFKLRKYNLHEVVKGVVEEEKMETLKENTTEKSEGDDNKEVEEDVKTDGSELEKIEDDSKDVLEVERNLGEQVEKDVKKDGSELKKNGSAEMVKENDSPNAVVDDSELDKNS